MENQKDLHEGKGAEVSSAMVNYIYGLSFQSCTFHNTTIQTLVQGGEASVQGGEAPSASADGESTHEEEHVVGGEEKAASLRTPEASLLMERLVKAGLLDAAWQPVGLSNAEKGVLASLLARRLGIANLWQVFGGLWGMKPETLRTACNKGMDQRRTAKFMERVKRVMEGEV